MWNRSASGLCSWPLTFLLYMNDIYKVSKELTLFADDTNLLCSHKNLETLELTVNNELVKLYDWLTVNRLTLNTKKSISFLDHIRNNFPVTYLLRFF